MNYYQPIKSFLIIHIIRFLQFCCAFLWCVKVLDNTTLFFTLFELTLSFCKIESYWFSMHPTIKQFMKRSIDLSYGRLIIKENGVSSSPLSSMWDSISFNLNLCQPNQTKPKQWIGRTPPWPEVIKTTVQIVMHRSNRYDYYWFLSVRSVSSVVYCMQIAFSICAILILWCS